MSLYLDTSALVKLYVTEAFSADVRRWVDAAARVASSRIAYPEARAALARRHRESKLTAAEHRAAVRDLDRDFTGIVVVEVDPLLASAAGDLAERRGLRVFDTIHLAAALALRRGVPEFDRFAAFDSRLEAAARAEGLLPP